MFFVLVVALLGFAAYDSGVVGQNGFDASAFDNNQHNACQLINGDNSDVCKNFDVFDDDYNSDFDGN